LTVWACIGIALMLALLSSANQRRASFTVTVSSMYLDRSVWDSSTRPTYRLQKVTVNGQTSCLVTQDLDSGYVDSVNWESSGVRIKVATTAPINEGDAMLWVFSTTPNQPRVVVPFSQGRGASAIDYRRLMSTPYCP
jgi:hypothetical protein